MWWEKWHRLCCMNLWVATQKTSKLDFQLSKFCRGTYDPMSAKPNLCRDVNPSSHDLGNDERKRKTLDLWDISCNGRIDHTESFDMSHSTGKNATLKSKNSSMFTKIQSWLPSRCFNYGRMNILRKNPDPKICFGAPN